MRWFANLRSMMKLITGFGVVSIIVAVVGTVGLSKMADITAKARVISNQGLDGLAAIEDAHLDFVSHDRALLAAVSSAGSAERDGLAADLLFHRTAFLHGLQNVDVLVDNADVSRRLAQVRARWDAYEQSADAVVEALRAGDPPAIQSALASMAAASEPLDAEIDELARERQRSGQAAFTQAQAAYESSQMTMIVLVLGAVLTSALIGIGIGRMVSQPLVQAASVLSSVAEGDFTRRLDVDTSDEVGTMAVALNAAIGDVSSALQEVRLSAYAVSAASSELSSASQDISNGAQEQASSIEESAGSLEQLTATLRHNAERAQQANMAALTSRDVAEKGGESVVSAVAAMEEINRASKRISEIITAIDEIAFQTNLLALNAAVEAARAGEQGRGFAVVASEVRNLAQRSATAAREIKSLIDDSVDKIDKGAELVSESGETLAAIIVSVKQVSDIVAEIASASREQAAGIEQVSRAVSQMDHVTQSNAAQTEELSGTAESLAAQSHHLKSLVSRFQLDEGDVGAPARPSAATRPSPPARPRAEAPARPAAVRRPSLAPAPSVAAVHDAQTPAAGPRHGDDLDAFFEEI